MKVSYVATDVTYRHTYSTEQKTPMIALFASSHIFDLFIMTIVNNWNT